jgi:hypothetical protein
MTRLPWGLALSLFSTALSAQGTTVDVKHSISGVVYDSIGRAPLAGAVVQAALIDSTVHDRRMVGAPTRTFTAITDSTGAFRIVGLPSGQFAVAFQHDALSALGIESPIRGVNLGADSSVFVDLGVPSGRTIRASLCPKMASDAPDAALVGYVVDATTGIPAKDTKVAVQWMELNLRRGTLQSTARGVTADVGDNGRYVVCGIPADGPVSVGTESRAFHKVEVEMTFPDAGVARRDFRLASSKDIHGLASITLRVVDDSGAPIPAGRAQIPQLDRDVVIENGKASLTDVPVGSWSVLVRAFGFQPLVIVADAAPNETSVVVRMERLAIMLDTMNITSNIPRGDRETLTAIEQRMLVAAGTLIRSDNPYLLSATEPSQAIVAARGFTYKGPNVVEGRPYPSHWRMMTCASVAGSDTRIDSGKSVAVYVDGTRFPAGLEAVNNSLRPNQILAIEAYSDVESAPFLWRTNDACAVVAFWTKHAAKKP